MQISSIITQNVNSTVLPSPSMGVYPPEPSIFDNILHIPLAIYAIIQPHILLILAGIIIIIILLLILYCIRKK
jgi:hypothetical protein